jgi:protein-arginine kinase activator protein McsA
MDQAAYIPEKSKDDSGTFTIGSEKNTLADLKQALQKAVEAEEYEKAADIRDQIKKLESGS